MMFLFLCYIASTTFLISIIGYDKAPHIDNQSFITYWYILRKIQIW